MKSLICKPKFELGVVLLAAGMLGANGVMAQSLSGSDVSGAPGSTVEVELEWESAGDVSGLTVEINYDEDFLDVDVSNCVGSLNEPHASDSGTACIILNPGQLSLIVNDALGSNEIESHTFGSLSFTIDSSADEGEVYPVEFTVHGALDLDGDDLSDLGAITTTNGSVTVEAATDDGSELAVTPSDHDFGTINVGDNDSTTFTAENVGDADLDITDVSISGASQFTIANDDCGGQTLTPGDTCEVDVDFDGDAEGTYSAEITFESDADVNDEVVVEVTGEVVEDNGAEEGFTVDFDGGLGTGDAGETLDSTGTVVYEGDTSGSLSCELSGDVFSSNPDPLDFTFAESGSEEFTISCTLPEDAEDGQDYGGALSCTDENDEVVYSGELSCSVTADEPEPTPAVPVPTMQSWGIALFSLIMLAIGGLSIRAFRS